MILLCGVLPPMHVLCSFHVIAGTGNTYIDVIGVCILYNYVEAIYCIVGSCYMPWGVGGGSTVHRIGETKNEHVKTAAARQHNIVVIITRLKNLNDTIAD